jgi:predicted anti-sigma-YlaC factor YlaD
MSKCDRYRDALSARMDGEDPGIPEARIDAHLEQCAKCRTWATAAEMLTGQVVGSAGPPLPAAALADILDEADEVARRRRSLGE